MAYHCGQFSPFDKSQLHYYAKAPQDEDLTHQPSAAEDMSIGLAEDVAYIISGTEGGESQSSISDVHLFRPTTGNRAVLIARVSVANCCAGSDDTKLREAAADHLCEADENHIMIGYACNSAPGTRSSKSNRNITRPTTVSTIPGMRHVGCRSDICYYSSFKRSEKISTFGKPVAWLIVILS